MNSKPILRRVKGGWAAFGDGWAVHAPQKEEAARLFAEAEERHSRIDERDGRKERAHG